MPTVPLRLDRAADADELAAGFDAIRTELGLDPAFPAAVMAEAEDAARRGPAIAADADLRDIPFVTIDPPGSRDLDQALHLSRATTGGGYVLHYAIADVAAFVAPGGAIDGEARRRGVTVYLPDGRVPLHPPLLSEGAASLLPGEERQALVWTIAVDADGSTSDVRVERATVRSRRQYAYPEVQAAIDAGTADGDGILPLLKEVGLLLLRREADRGGISLNLPEQLVTRTGGRYELGYRAPVAAESWNAQLSLVTGMAAARLMIDAGVGVLRTLPPPSDAVVDDLRRRAAALGVPWPHGGGYRDFVATLDSRVPEHAALVTQAARLLRGAGYVSFDGAVPPHHDHAAVAAPYTHVTAPLRRLVDRFGNEVVLAACAGREPPSWARDALPELPEVMADARRREGSADGMALDLVEAAVLSGRVGDVVRAVVVDVDDRGAKVQVQHPAVVARVDGDAGLRLGATVELRVVSADRAARKVVLRPA